MAGAATNRFGGNALLAGGILWTIAVFLHPDVSSLALATAASPGMWALVHWAYLIGDVLLIAGMVTLFRHVAGTGEGSSEGWGAVALASGVLGFTLDAASTVIHLNSFPPSVPAGSPNLPNIYDALSAVNGAVGAGGFFAASLGLLALGLALKKAGWSSAVAYGAIAVGGLQVLLVLGGSITGAAPIPAGMAALAVNALLPLCFAFVGMSYAKVGAT